MSAAGFAHLMETVARHLLGEPNAELSTEMQLRFGTRGSMAIDLKRGVFYDHQAGVGGVLDLVERQTGRANGEAVEWLRAEGFDVTGDTAHRPFTERIVCTYSYFYSDGIHAFDVVRLRDPKDFRMRAPDGTWKVKGIRSVLYRLPEILEAPEDALVLVVEGEKDVDRLLRLRLRATTSPGGAGKWRDEYADGLSRLRVVAIADSDDAGRKHAAAVVASFRRRGVPAAVLHLDGLPPKGDVSDWLDAGGTPDLLLDLAAAALQEPAAPETEAANQLQITDFVAFMPTHAYVFIPTRETWAAASVNTRVTAPNGKQTAAAWLDQHGPVEQMTWAPGGPMLIKDRLIAEGGWIIRPGCTVFNLYRPPEIARKPGPVTLWADHIKQLFGPDAQHIIRFLAHRVQRPHEKINHALVLGGDQGIGKDTILEPVKHAVGPWNFFEVSPQQVLGRFNGFLKSVILRVSEARDLGDSDRFSFYDHLKTLTAAPPDVLRVDEKHRPEYSIPNVCGVIITTNHKADGIYLPADDRRHFVAWSSETKDNFSDAYWQAMWSLFESGGFGAIANYLANLDLSGFNPKAPPPKTDAFWEIVNASRVPENAELADTLDKLGWPDAVTLQSVVAVADASFSDWLTDRKHRRQAPHRMEECGYVPARNDAAADGLWKVNGRRQVIYAKRELSVRARHEAAALLVTGGR